MGFRDKAKKMAEQAQQKVDEVQKQFHERGAQTPPDPPSGVRYDEHGRPIQDDSASAADPATAQAVDQPQPPEEDTAPPPASGATNANPDPLKPRE